METKHFLHHPTDGELVNAKQRFLSHVTLEYTHKFANTNHWVNEFCEGLIATNQVDVIRYLDINPDLTSYFHELWRKENFEQLESLSFITTALNRQIRFHDFRNTSNVSVLRLYRREFVNNEFIERIRENVNHLIMFRGFWSASLFDHCNTSALTNLLFIINIDLTLQHRSTFAELSQWIENSERGEVIFSLGSVFQIESIDFEAETSFYTVNLSLVADNRIAVDMFVRPLGMTDQSIQFENAVRYGNLFYYSDLIEFALECYLMIDHARIDDKIPDSYRSIYYSNIGLCYFHLGEKVRARDYFERHIEAFERIWGISSSIPLYTDVSRLYLSSTCNFLFS